MATISRLTGLSPLLLRAWERRYGLLRPSRGPGGHRLYSDDDLHVLETVRELIGSGRSIGEIAAIGRESLLQGKSVPQQSGPDGPEAAEAGDHLDQKRARIVRAALDLDPDTLNRTLDEVAATVSIPTLIRRVIEPAAREIGDLWQGGDCTVASEHLASSIFSHRLHKLIESAESGPDGSVPLAIAACLPDEQHQLGLLILSYFLGRDGIRVLFLGASLPFRDLEQACRSSRPAGVLLSVARRSTFRKHRDTIRDLILAISHPTRFYLGGLGAPRQDDELEGAGLRLARRDEAAEDAARRIAQDLSVGRRPARRFPR